MTPTLAGRLQTRVVAILMVGLPWTLFVTPFLPNPDLAPIEDRYIGTITVLTLVLVLGLGWEVVYDRLQQYRWEKDWPTLLGLVTAVNEGLLCFLVGRPLVESLVDSSSEFALGTIQGVVAQLDVSTPEPSALPVSTFFVHFMTTWILIWAFTGGPLRIFSLRWRIDGGRLW